MTCHALNLIDDVGCNFAKENFDISILGLNRLQYKNIGNMIWSQQILFSNLKVYGLTCNMLRMNLVKEKI